MKKCMLGVSILLFAILFKLCSNGMGAIALVIGIVGLGITISGIIIEDV
jgi:hypothetical protein